VIQAPIETIWSIQTDVAAWPSGQPDVDGAEAEGPLGVGALPSGVGRTGQRPEFEEYTVVLAGSVHLETDSGTLEVGAGQAVLVRAGEWVRYFTPQRAEYVSICPPAFSPDTVHRDA
jgi:mannose-6-phosphate isomerase-like protein (cupin superfamily)